MRTIMVKGNPVDGFTFVGPFPDRDSAMRTGDSVDSEWWVADVETPEDGDANDPTIDQVYETLESAIDEVCDVDTRNEISAVYRRLMREQGFSEGNEESDDEEG